MKLNFYRIRRDHSNETKFFRVWVPEAGHSGYGFQVRVGPCIYGCSLWWITKAFREEQVRNKFGLDY